MTDTKERKNSKEKRYNKRHSQRMSYILPVALAILFIALDFYGICKGTNAHAAQYNVEGKGIEYVNCGLDLFIGYIPSGIFALMCFAFVQQGIYRVDAGLRKDKIPMAYFAVFLYGISYVVFLLVGNSRTEKWAITIVTLVFYLFTWFVLLDPKVRKDEKKQPYNITGKC